MGRSMRADSGRGRAPRGWHSRCVVIALLALAACGDRAPTRFVASAVATAAPEAVRRAPSAIRTHPSPAALDFKQFALNALLLPLLDDDLPPRWADPSLSVACDDAWVTVDGARPDVGALVPTSAFTVRWHMERCSPIDGYIELSGDVEVRVEPRGDGYTASVRPLDLHVISSYGVDALSDPFPARMKVGP